MAWLHETKDEFRNAVLFAAEQNRLAPAAVEKDYYVTLLLKEIVSSNPDIIFKGGTSLSKCFQIVNRFSEDLDIGLNVDKATEGMRRGLKRCIFIHRSIWIASINFLVSKLITTCSSTNIYIKMDFSISTDEISSEKIIRELRN